MAVAVVMNFEGATPAQYDEIIGKMGLTPGGPGPSGEMFHWVAETDTGMLVTDVWETREGFEKFSEEQIGPFGAEVGLPNPPSVTFHDVHNHFTAG